MDLFLQIVLEVIKTIVRELVVFVVKKITSKNGRRPPVSRQSVGGLLNLKSSI
ncbi:hypothetical protein G5716_28470 [Bacillus pacificus]|nr:hypothetical protein [Bacillus pacificus]NIA61055.1 hypothetical protein [Bacillus pacificus]